MTCCALGPCIRPCGSPAVSSVGSSWIRRWGWRRLRACWWSPSYWVAKIVIERKPCRPLCASTSLHWRRCCLEDFSNKSPRDFENLSREWFFPSPSPKSIIVIVETSPLWLILWKSLNRENWDTCLPGALRAVPYSSWLPAPEVSYRSLEHWVSGWNLKEFREKCGDCGALWVVGFTSVPSKMIVDGCWAPAGESTTE